MLGRAITSTELKKRIFLKNCSKRNIYKFQPRKVLVTRLMNTEFFLIRKLLIFPLQLHVGYIAYHSHSTTISITDYLSSYVISQSRDHFFILFNAMSLQNMSDHDSPPFSFSSANHTDILGK